MTNQLLILKAEPGFPISLDQSAIIQKNAAILALKDITSVAVDTLQSTGDILAKGASIVKHMELSRVDVKAPVLDLGKRIDTMAKDFTAPLQTELDRVKRLVSDHHAREAARVAEENRKREEAERKRAEEIARAEREALAKADKERWEAEAKARRAKTEESALLRETQAAEAVKRQQELLAQQEADRIAEAARIAALKPLEVAKVEGVSSRKVWKYEVLDPAKVYAAHPLLCRVEVVAYNVNYAIKKGLRECPGLRIYEDVETKIRAK